MNSVILMTVDCLRADHVGCYGYNKPTTPNLDKLAEDSTVFKHAYANCPGTRWAIQALHTGLWTSQIDGLGIPPDYDAVLAEQFADAGYATAAFSNNGFVSSDYGYDAGFDYFVDVHELSNREHIAQQIGRRLDAVFDSQEVRNRVLRPIRNVFNQLRHFQSKQGFKPDVPDSIITDAALNWIADREETDDSYFVWLHFMNAHTPYGRWTDHLRAIRGDTDIGHTIHPGDEGLVEEGQEPPERVIDAYDAGIHSVDEQIGRLIDAVNEDTSIIVTGDHGEEFGRQNPFHTESFYKEFVHVPLIIRSTEITPGRKSGPVQHLDLPPTILRSASIDPPDSWRGNPLQTTNRNSNDPIFFDLDRNRKAVHQGEWKLIYQDDHPELYRIEHGQFEDAPVNSQYPNKSRELINLLDKQERRLNAVRLSGRFNGEDSLTSDEISDEVKENLENLGYVE